MNSDEFGAVFWITVLGAVLGFGGVVLQAMLKSRCARVKMCGFECERPASADTADVNLDVPDFNNLSVVR